MNQKKKKYSTASNNHTTFLKKLETYYSNFQVYYQLLVQMEYSGSKLQVKTWAICIPGVEGKGAFCTLVKCSKQNIFWFQSDPMLFKILFSLIFPKMWREALRLYIESHILGQELIGVAFPLLGCGVGVWNEWCEGNNQEKEETREKRSSELWPYIALQCFSDCIPCVEFFQDSSYRLRRCWTVSELDCSPLKHWHWYLAGKY